MQLYGFTLFVLFASGLVFKTAQRDPMCPKMCHCISRLNQVSGVHEDVTDCSSALLSALPQGVPNTTEILILKDNRLSDVDGVFSLELSRLVTLDVSYNKLNRLSKIYPSDEVPRALFELTYLKIDWNTIDYLGESLFRGLDSLKELSISHNIIERIHPKAFIGLFNLTRLNLSGNRLNGIVASWFVDLSELLVLNMAGNTIDSLQAGVFSSLIKLQVLDLSNCGLRRIMPDAFSGLEVLQKLYIQHNKLHNVPTLTLQVFADLRLMDISSNRITQLGPQSFYSINVSNLILNDMEGLTMIDTFAFQNLPRLSTLEIEGNRNLEYIDSNGVLKVPNLQRLKLSGNNIQSIPSKLLGLLPDNVSLDIQRNPLSCDCNIGWLENARRTGRVVINGFENLECVRNDSRWLVSAVIGNTNQDGCSPIITPRLPSTVKQLVTKPVVMRCLGAGNPEPDIRWRLPSGSLCKSGSVCVSVNVDQHGTLNIPRLAPSLQGVYTCLAVNKNGNIRAPINVTAEKFKTHALILEIGSDFLKYTWTDLDWVNHFEMQYKYEVLLIQYINRGHDWRILRKFDIKPYMKYSTFNGLKSQQSYGVCVPNTTEILILKDNRLSDVDGVFSLELSRLVTLDVSYNKLNRLSKIYPSDEVPRALFELTYLKIDWNTIDYLGESLFRGLDSLKELSISHNIIERIHPKAFIGLFNLTRLNLSGNRLNGIVASWFVDLSELLVLNMAGNTIDSLQAGVFSSLIKLQVLDLSNCGLRRIMPDAFSGLEVLQKLYIQHNKLHNVPTLTLQVFADLRLMDISSNRITQLGPQSFYSINVSNLILNDMEGLTMIDTFAFQNLPRLSTLEIEGNRNLEYIDSNAVLKVPNLQRLKLSGNNIQSIPSKLLGLLPDNVSLDIQRNPLSCDCNIGWLENARRTGRVVINGFENLECVRNDSRWLVSAVIGNTNQDGCSPIITPRLPSTVKQLVTKPVVMRCLGAGNPEPDIRWRLPSGSLCKSGSVCVSVNVDQHGTLNIPRLAPSLQGVYTCLAVNKNGNIRAPINVTAEKFKTHALILEIGSDFLKYTWTDLDWVNHFEMQYKYEVLLIQYINRGHDWRILRKFDIKPYMKYSTFNGLKSQQSYGVCITIDGEHDKALMNCKNVTTLDKVLDDHYRMVRNYVLGIGLTVLFVGAAATTVCLVLINRYNRRHERTMSFLCGTGRQSRLCSVETDSPSETFPISYENRGASSEPVFNEDDLEEIRESISLARSGSTESRQAFSGNIDE
ncbi:uncharacterized protein LOC106166963 [Lingula anatina]|uniref:Uncharacterized protein LOC106166963 n=1 Tax=Lingula anatina TaxID=7574 RepID=A0A2R2MRS6_LINAN|nr:uncharacterized protein LOC106166963 [Lingula anatina]|eukprot:XP_023932959.1 uncharacterized protein LOC106166963 [Lingula anatina]